MLLHWYLVLVGRLLALLVRFARTYYEKLNKWLTATYRLNTRDFSYTDEQIEWLYKLRSAFALFGVMLANVVWGHDPDAYLDTAMGTWASALVTGVAILAWIVVACAVLLVVIAPKGERRRCLASMVVTLRLAVIVGVIFVAIDALNRAAASGAFLDRNGSWLSDAFGHFDDNLLTLAVYVIVLFLAFIFVTWLPMFVVVFVGLSLFQGGWLLVEHSFRAVDAHPALRAVSAIGFALATVAIGVTPDREVGSLPSGLEIFLLIALECATVCIAVCELHKLRKKGVGLRWAPLP